MKALVIVLLLCSSTVFAQPKKVEAENAYKYGQSLYMKEDYEGAAKQFKAAYDLDPDPVYLFNVGQAFRLAKKCKDAGDNYRRYLKEAKKAPNAEAVKAYITEVDECAKAQEPVAPMPPVEPPKVEPQPLPEPAPAQPEDRPSSGSKKRLVGYIVGGAGVGMVGLGFLFMSQVSSFESDADAVCPNPCPAWDTTKTEARGDIDDKAHLREKLMIGSFIAGGAAIAAGIYLVVTGGEKTESSVSITPTKNGAMASFRF